MSINLSDDLTTGVDWEWSEVTAAADLPVRETDYSTIATGATVSKTFKLRHRHDSAVHLKGFYLTPVEDLADYYPFTEKWKDKTPEEDIRTLLYWGDYYGDGLKLVTFNAQDDAGNFAEKTTTGFKNGSGSSISNAIAFNGATEDGAVDADEVRSGMIVRPQERVRVKLILKVPENLEVTSTDFLNFNVKIAYYRNLDE